MRSFLHSIRYQVDKGKGNRDGTRLQIRIKKLKYNTENMMMLMCLGKQSELVIIVCVYISKERGIGIFLVVCGF